MKTNTKKLVVHNNTPFNLDTIAGFVKLGNTVNKWRQRNVTLLQHPTEPNNVVSVGTTFDQSMQVIAVESKDAWIKALDYASRGKVYVSE